MAGSAPAPRTQGSQEVEHHDAHAPVVVNGISSDDEPSVEWGWHGHYPKVARYAGFVVAAVLVVFLIGNHTGKVEDIWLVGFALVFVALSIGSIMRTRKAWRR